MKKILPFLLVLSLVLTFGSPIFAAKSDKIDSLESRIQELYNQRAELVLKENYDQKEIDKIEKKLEKLGVKFLTAKEVKEKFSDAYIELNQIDAQVDVPTQSNISWSTYRGTVFTGGEKYDVQRLVAQANSKDSDLKDSGYKYLSSSYNWKAGSMNALTTLASTAAGEIPGASTALTVYDMASGFASGISKETTVTDAEISYSWSQVTTVVFSYVRLDSLSDDYQELTYISSKVNVWVGWQYPVFECVGGSVYPNGVQGNRTINVVPDGYDSGINAVMAYIDPYAKTRATVSRIKLTGIETDLVSYIYPVDPVSPVQLF